MHGMLPVFYICFGIMLSNVVLFGCADRYTRFILTLGVCIIYTLYSLLFTV